MTHSTHATRRALKAQRQVPPARSLRAAGGWYRARVGHALVDCTTWDEAVEAVLDLGRDNGARRHLVVTPNIQHIVLLEDLEELREAYEAAALVLPDGAPVAVLAGSQARLRQRRVTGADLLPSLCWRASEEGLSVGFLGGQPGAAAETARRMVERYPALRVALVEEPAFNFEYRPDELAEVVARVGEADPDLLFVGLGAPKQESFVLRHGDRLGSGVALCVGAAIDYSGGKARRAPVTLQRLGLEWLWRFKEEPRRLGPRYLRAAPRFSRVVGWRLLLAVLQRPFLPR